MVIEQKQITPEKILLYLDVGSLWAFFLPLGPWVPWNEFLDVNKRKKIFFFISEDLSEAVEIYRAKESNINILVKLKRVIYSSKTVIQMIHSCVGFSRSEGKINNLIDFLG